MFRFRRFRVFAIVAVFTLVALYHIGKVNSWEKTGIPTVEQLTHGFGTIKGSGSQSEAERQAQKALDKKPLAGGGRESGGFGEHGGSGPGNAGQDAGQGHDGLPAKIETVIGKYTPTTTSATSLKGATGTDGEVAGNVTPTPTGTVTRPPHPFKDKRKTKVAEEESSTIAPAKVEADTFMKPSTEPITPETDKPAVALGHQHSAITHTTASSYTIPTIHWTRLPEHFPIPPARLIHLPTGKPHTLPKIQHAFKDEALDAKIEREKKLAIIKESFLHSWNGYKKYAWLHDELKPVSGDFRDGAFCGWSATLVDALDTLWIMGLEDEFQDALDGLAQIDFTTSTRNDIPLFETTIRYLGGMLSAYDISGGQYKILLNKAVELAEVLMGAFDTPNRMPDTYYSWKPAFLEQPKRAKARVVMAELGSLSVEFTRLAQLTREPKYYDAIARITDELASWQDNTRVPGLWPLFVDASGCKKADIGAVQPWQQKLLGDNIRETVGPNGTVMAQSPVQPADDDGETVLKSSANDDLDDSIFSDGASIGKVGKIQHGGAGPHQDEPGGVPIRQVDGVLLGEEDSGSPRKGYSGDEDEVYWKQNTKDNEKLGQSKRDVSTDSEALEDKMQAIKVDCEPQGLASPPNTVTEDFTFGGMADSTYEYLPKQYMLLGGLVPQYKDMYEKAVDAANKLLLFRAMTPDNADILVLGKARAKGGDLSKADNFQLEAWNEHLLCFTGGMYAMGAKLFGRDQDLALGAQMTESCVWAYGVTETGIMPEGFAHVACPGRWDQECKWNQSLWEEVMDPYEEQRKTQHAAQLELNSEIARLATMSTTTTAAERMRQTEKPEVAQELKDAVGGTTAEAHSTMSTIDADAVADAWATPTETGGIMLDTRPPPLRPIAKRQLGSVDNDPDVVPEAKGGDRKDDLELPKMDLSHWANSDDPKVKAAAAAAVKNLEGGAIEAKEKLVEVGKEINEGKRKNAIGKGDDGSDDDESVQPKQDGDRGMTRAQSKQHVPEAKHTADSAAEEDGLTYEPSATTQQTITYIDPNSMTHKEYVEYRMKQEGLPKGMPRIGSRNYILRPEAIESVFYLYRITGDPIWREKGWKMFKAIEKATRAKYGHSAINNVLSGETPMQNDGMESFWLAETLKYFYLLFSEETVVSLDDWVLNTEAHPFKRPVRVER